MPSRAALIRMLARVTRRAKRSGRIGESLLPSSGSASGRSAWRGLRLGGLERAAVALDDQLEPLRGEIDQLRRPEQPCAVAQLEHPRGDRARIGVLGLEHRAVSGCVVGLGRRLERARVAVVALDQPVDAAREPDPGGALGLAELPVGAGRVPAMVEVLRAREVVLGLGRVGDLPADAREPEDADVLALVRVADQIELPALVEELVRVDLALLLRVAADRVVVEHDRLAAEDRRLDLRQPLRQLAPAGLGGLGERDRLVLGRAERRRLAPRELLEREPQRLRVGELAVEQAERHPQRAELGVRELDRRQVEVLRRQRVALRLVRAVGGLVDLQVDAERLELRAVRVEAAREGVVVHARVALHLLLDLERGDRAPLGHQERDQRQLPYELFGVFCHCAAQHKEGKRTAGARYATRLRAFPLFAGWLGGVAAREVRRAVQSAVEARPALAVAERLLEPVEAAELAAEVVDRVDECGLARARDHRAAVLERAVVGQDDVEDGLGRLGREARDLLDLAPDDVVPERDLALELAGVREVDRLARPSGTPRSCRCRAGSLR